MTDKTQEIRDAIDEIESKYFAAARQCTSAQKEFLDYVRKLESTGDEEEDERLVDFVNDTRYNIGLTEVYKSFSLERASEFEAWEPSTC
ncbi:hypothetical protein [Stenotrophomonas phage IME-SM1]|uniref:Uncharacterized protein n=2 Tax=Menderavirus IMESM1 TaxID=2846388 RepID=A0A0H4J2F0_9CAUD|nr:hypothetical protein HWC11_gp121 [Stenotrophomonas phage YB07]YP_010077746.1 hypothetical protein KMC40_gp001 [Stenotrophomonas phage IME-SM1]QXN67227.1 hypothetical protein [Stenotrophomonas phage BUCT608]AKO61553.1 hypothetical protein [Stenotrophomonas phage IME-SM1]QBP06317.1 hypothetical protein [Stenotrophomonas phage YB07]QYC97364.1 hypothetical protein [Stenotrophomonas phage BUCT608]